MVALNVDVSRTTVRNRAWSATGCSARCTTELPHKSGCCQTDSVPRAETASFRKATEPSPHPLRVHPPATIEDPIDFSEPRNAGFHTDTEESDQLATQSRRHRPEGVDGLGSLPVEVVHRPTSVVSRVGEPAVYSDVLQGVPATALPCRRFVAIGTHARTQARRRRADAHLSRRPEGSLFRLGRAASELASRVMMAFGRPARPGGGLLDRVHRATKPSSGFDCGVAESGLIRRSSRSSCDNLLAETSPSDRTESSQLTAYFSSTPATTAPMSCDRENPTAHGNGRLQT